MLWDYKECGEQRNVDSRLVLWALQHLR